MRFLVQVIPSSCLQKLPCRFLCYFIRRILGNEAHANLESNTLPRWGNPLPKPVEPPAIPDNKTNETPAAKMKWKSDVSGKQTFISVNQLPIRTRHNQNFPAFALCSASSIDM
jgi:hypothetical protein